MSEHEKITSIATPTCTTNNAARQAWPSTGQLVGGPGDATTAGCSRGDGRRDFGRREVGHVA